MFFSMYLFRFQIEPSCCVEVGGTDGQNGVWCPIRWKGVSMMCNLSMPCLANVFASSFPEMFVWALTLHTMMLC